MVAVIGGAGEGIVRAILLLADRVAGIETNCGLGLLSAWGHSFSCELFRLGRREQDFGRNVGRNVGGYGGRWDLLWC